MSTLRQEPPVENWNLEMPMVTFETTRNLMMQYKYGQYEHAMYHLIEAKKQMLEGEYLMMLATFKQLEEKFDIEVPCLGRAG
jgi:hypothetical protein